MNLNTKLKLHFFYLYIRKTIYTCALKINPASPACMVKQLRYEYQLSTGNSKYVVELYAVTVCVVKFR